MKVFLDDVRIPLHTDGYNPEEWTVVRTARQTFDLVMTGNVKEMSLDHDLGNGPTGYDMLNWIEEKVFSGEMDSVPIMRVHSGNPVGRKRMYAAIESIEKILEGRQNTK